MNNGAYVAFPWKQLQKVNRPEIVKTCNEFIGGVDYLDFLIALRDSRNNKEMACENNPSFCGFGT